MVKTLTYVLLGKDALSPVARKAGAETEGAFGRMGAAAATFGKAAGLGTLAVGAGLAVIAGESVKAAISFQSSMERIHTQAGVSQKQIGVLGDGILKLAGQVGYDPNSLAESLYHVESAFASLGISSPKALSLVKIAAQGAKVGNADLVDVTNALGAAIASGIPGVQNYSQAMGALNAIVGSGDMHMQDLAEAFGTGMVAVVKGFGLSLTDVGAALATFGDNNIRGADAATALRMSVMALAVPAAAGKKQLQEWGVSSNQFAKDMQTGGLLKALEHLQELFKANGVSAKEQGQVITEMFGKKAGTGLNVLLDQMDRLKSKYPEIAKGANTFGDAVKANNATAKQQFADLRASVEAIGVRFGTALLPPLTAFASFLNTKILPVVGNFVGRLASGFSGSGAAGFVSTLIAAFKNLIPVVAPLVKMLLGVVGPDVIASFHAFASLMTGSVAPALKTTTGFIKDNATWFQSAAIAVGIFTVAVKGQAIAIAIWGGVTKVATIATKAFAVAQAVLTAVMDANPIVLVIGALIALGAAFYYAWTHSATFRKFVIGAWDDVKAAANSAWKDVLKPTFDALVIAWDAVVSAFRTSVSWVVGVFNSIKNFVSGNFDPWWKANGQAIKDIWNAVWLAISTVVKAVWIVIRAYVAAGWAVVSTLFKFYSSLLRVEWSIFWTVISTAVRVEWLIIQGILRVGWIVIRTLFDTFIAYLTASWRIFWAVVSNMAKVTWAAIRALLKIGWDLIVGIFTVAIDLLTGKWGKAWNAMKGMLVQIWNAMKTFLGTALGAFKNIFSTTLDTVVGFFRGLGGRLLGAMKGIGSLLVNTGKSIIAGLFSGITSALSGIVNWARTNLFDPIVHAVKSLFGIRSPSTVFAGLGSHLMTGFIKGMLTHDLTGLIGNVFGGMPQALAQIVERGIIALSALPGKALNALGKLGGKIGGFFTKLFGGGGGSGVTRWMPQVIQALAMNGLPMSLAGQVLAQMQTESGGNPTAINLNDFNATVLHDPSRGLMQVIGSTFAAFHVPGTSNNIFDPLANIAAAINYAKLRYGPTLMTGGMGIGSGHGYASGTSSARRGWAWVGEGGVPELVHFNGGEQVGPVMRRGGNGGNSYYITVNPTPLAHPRDIGREVVGAIREFEKGSGKGWRNS